MKTRRLAIIIISIIDGPISNYTMKTNSIHIEQSLEMAIASVIS